MCTRIKLRVCTWNVGNAQPPSDLSAWLGTNVDEYDIIVVGAQEANFGSEKVPSPTSVASPYSTVESFTPSTNSETFVSPSSSVPNDAAAAPSVTSRRFRKLSRVVRTATGPWRSNSNKLQKLKSEKKVDTSAEAFDARHDAFEEDREWTSNSEDGKQGEVEEGIPTSTNSSTGDLKQRLLTFRSGEGCRAGEENGDGFYVPVRAFEDIYGSSQAEKTERYGQNTDISDGDVAALFESESERSATKLDAYQSEDEESSDAGGIQRSNSGEVAFDPDPQSRDEDSEEAENETQLPEVLEKSRTMVARKGTKGPLLRAAYSLRDGVGDVLTEESQRGPNATSSKKFSQAVIKALPDEYHLVTKCHLMEIKLLVFVRDRLRSRVEKTETVVEATGLGNVVGNKGGVAVKLRLDDTTFCFICSHLAAHEGAKFLQQRHEDVVEIMRNIERKKIHGLPAIHQFHHVFWMGDLNYRLDLKRVIPAAVTWTHQERWCYVVDLIANRRYEELAGFDELIQEIAEKKVFAGFEEGKIRFPPTFKMNRGKPYSSYQSLRVPSYCDRILWHSLPLHKAHIKLREYRSVTEMDTSDHKPVFAVFDLVIPQRVRVYALPAPRDTLKCTLDFTSLRVHGLYEKRGDGSEEQRRSRYEVLSDGALALVGEGEESESGCGAGGAHTRRMVHADFHGAGLFVGRRVRRAEVPLRDGARAAGYDALPAIAVRPVGSLRDLAYHYVTVVFTRLGSRQGSSCVLPVAWLVRQPGRHGGVFQLELTKYGAGVARVELGVELVVSFETWIDRCNRRVKVQRR